MRPVGISCIEYYVPDTEVAVDDLIDDAPDDVTPSHFHTRDQFKEYIHNVLNLRTIRVESQRSTEEMFEIVLYNLFQRDRLGAESIQTAILAQEQEFGCQRNLLQALQFKCGFRNANLFAVSGNHCANIHVAMKIARAMMAADASLQRLLILSSSHKRHEPPGKRIIGSYGILGDAAGAMILDRAKDNIAVHDCVVINDGKFNQARESDPDFLVHCYHTKACLHTLLERSSTDAMEIDAVLLANANDCIARECLISAGISEAKIFTHNYGRYGHLDCVDVIVNLKDLVCAPSFTCGRILSFNVGLAGSYAATLLTT